MVHPDWYRLHCGPYRPRFEGSCVGIASDGPARLRPGLRRRFERSVGNHADVISVEMDADLSHRPPDLIALLNAVREGEGSHRIAIRAWRPDLELAATPPAIKFQRQLLHPSDRLNGASRMYKRLPLLASQALAAMPLDDLDAAGYAFLVQLLWEALQARLHSRWKCRSLSSSGNSEPEATAPSASGIGMLPWRLLLPRV